MGDSATADDNDDDDDDGQLDMYCARIVDQKPIGDGKKKRDPKAITINDPDKLIARSSPVRKVFMRSSRSLDPSSQPGGGDGKSGRRGGVFTENPMCPTPVKRTPGRETLHLPTKLQVVFAVTPDSDAHRNSVETTLD